MPKLKAKQPQIKNLDDLATQIFESLVDEVGHEYRVDNKTDHYVCECGVDLGDSANYGKFEENKRKHDIEGTKDLIQNFLDDQKDWDSVASALFGVK